MFTQIEAVSSGVFSIFGDNAKIMRTIILLLVAGSFFASCGSGSGKASFCDTTCSGEKIVFNGDAEFNQKLEITLNNCAADSIMWTHDKTAAVGLVYVPEFLHKNGQPNHIKVNKSAIKCAFQDSSYAWLSFNDCKTGRGYLLKLSYGGAHEKIAGALNDFDPKFSVHPDLRAYTDRGNLFVVNVVTGQTDELTFRESYDIDFDNIHDIVDSVNVTKEKMFISLRGKNGKLKTFEKAISL